MKFNEIENLENLVISNEIPQNRFHQEIIIEFLEKEKRKLSAKENPFVYFYEDVISNSLTFNFQDALGSKYYKIASEDALCCLNICDEFYKLSSWNVSGWLQNALKFTDNIVVNYIQDILKEMPKKLPNTGDEKSRYIQLSKKTGDISAAGYVLIDLYNLRNELEHRTITHADGRQELLPVKRSKVRQIVVKLYPDVLRRILKTYREIN